MATQEVQWALGSVGSAGAMEKAGKVRFIAIAAPARLPLYGDVPATAESSSSKGYEVNAWVGLFAPKGTPKAVREKIAADMTEVLNSPELVERYRTLGYLPMHMAPDAFAQRMVSDTQGWAKIIRDANLKLD